MFARLEGQNLHAGQVNRLFSIEHMKALSMSSQIKRIFVIGATGAQGTFVVRGLVADGKYKVLALTRDLASERAQQLQAMGNVTLLEGSFADESNLRSAFRARDEAFVNIDGFNTVEKIETFLAITTYEIAVEESGKFYVYGNRDYILEKSGYYSRFRTGHYDGKRRVAEWILSQNRSNAHRMNGAVFRAGPPMEIAFSPFTPMTPLTEDGVVTWRVPLGQGPVVHVSLKGRWLFDNSERSVGTDLEVAIEHVRYDVLAAAFERMTETLGALFRHRRRSVSRRCPQERGRPTGQLQCGSRRQKYDEFPGQFHRILEYVEHDTITRDCRLLGEIHPNRLRTTEKWLGRYEDGARLTTGCHSGTSSSQRH